MATTAKVHKIPECQFTNCCSEDLHPAVYDFRMASGPWANGCDKAYLAHRMHPELGTGKGQKLELAR